MNKFERRAVTVELAMLAMTLVVTTFTGYGIYHQTSRHFAIQRTTSMMERLNSKDMVEVRLTTDHWLASKEAPALLLDRANDPFADKPDKLKTKEESAASAKAAEAKRIVQSLTVFCNFFQELGTADEHGTLDEPYMWDLFGSMVSRYGEELKPFVEEQRRRRGRPQLYQEFSVLTERMKVLDKKYARR